MVTREIKKEGERTRVEVVQKASDVKKKEKEREMEMEQRKEERKCADTERKR